MANSGAPIKHVLIAVKGADDLPGGRRLVRTGADGAFRFTYREPEAKQIELELLEQMARSVDRTVELIKAAHRRDSAEEVEQVLADLMPDLLNVLWRIGFYFVDGKTIVDEVQNLFTRLDQRPEGTTRRKSYQIMTNQDDCAASDYEAPEEEPPLVRLIHRQEYVVPADRMLDLANDILEAADRIRDREEDALILIVNLRFTQATRAMLGIQQYPLSGHVEGWTVRGMEGNPAFYALVDEIVARYEAVPHWGHVHAVGDLTDRYRRHATWRRQLDTIARRAGRPNTFRHDFVLQRGLLEELP